MPTSPIRRATPVLLGLLACLTMPALVRAQGTEEQTAACSGDAFTLCRGDIPDVAKITACMKVHKAQLSPRCRAVFDEATTPKVEPPKAASSRDAGAEPIAPQKAKAAKDTKTGSDAKAPKAPKGAAPKTVGGGIAGAQSAEVPRVVPHRRSQTTTVPSESITPPPVAAVAPPPAPPAPTSSSAPGLDSYRASIAKSCEQGLIDAYTCRSTFKMLDGM